MVPRFDKSLFDGKGDRAELDKWVRINTTTDIFLFEGWCLGFKHQNTDKFKEELIKITPELLEVNENLKNFEDIYSKFDAAIII